MRSDYRLPVGDWDTGDADMTEVNDPTGVLDANDLLAVEGSAPLVLPVEPLRLAQATQPVMVAPIAYVPMQRYEVPTIAPYAASAKVRVSGRLDATHRVERQSTWQRTALAAGIVGAIAIGVSVGIAVSSGGAALERPAAAAVVRAPAPRPIVTPIEQPTPAPKPTAAAALVDVRVESTPAGAEATLIDGDKATPLGATPLAVELDPHRTYDVMIALAGHATKVVHISPSASQRVMVGFDDTGHHAIRRARAGR